MIANPFTQRRGQSTEIYEFEKAGVRGLQEGFKRPGLLRVSYPEVRPEFFQKPESVYVDPKTTTPLGFLITENALDALAQANPGFDLWVSLIGLPLNIRQSAVWRDPEKPRFALLLPDWRMVGDRAAVREAFRSGKIVAAVINRPGAVPDDSMANGGYKAEFDRRFILVTPENVDALFAVAPATFSGVKLFAGAPD